MIVCDNACLFEINLDGNCWRLLTCAGGSQALLFPTEKEVTVFWLHPDAASFRVLWQTSGGRAVAWAVQPGRPGTSNLTSGQHLCPGCNMGQLRLSGWSPICSLDKVQSTVGEVLAGQT